MSDPNPPQAEPDPLSGADPAGGSVAERPGRAKGPSAGRIAWVVVPIVLLAALAGFGWALGWHEPLLSVFKPGLAPARGRITYNGKPVTEGYVETWPVSRMGETALGPLGADGKFQLATNGHPGATIGEHRLMVLAMTGGFPPKPITPSQYMQAATTPLRITVVADADKNTFEFDLKDQPE